ncbi:hypothetical protein AcW1_004272 [Taiwanofungus camphoratus]|nr:hypothetical protein AcW2_006717 [Antrodia cinnamomea]KAI0959453.1 hypothetical protein AcW1_004272 [Antrodia cinnamomea]
MAPKATGAALLFHPKPKKQTPGPGKKEGDDSRSPSPSKPRPLARPRPPKPKDTDDDLKPPPPEGPYAEFRLMSSALNGWKYDVMKFDSRKPVDIAAWQQPVKLNRKEPRREGDDGIVAAAPQPVGPMLGPDGKPVIGADGKIVMVDAEGRPIRPGETYANGSGADKGKDKDKGAAAKKRFQKKTKQVFLVPEATRQLRREERYPWVIEDGSQKELWVGKMEEVAKSETHAMFMPAANDVFKFVPAHRWYKFQKKPSYRVPTLEEAESLMSKLQRNKDPERWLLRNRNGQAPSDATTALFKSERSGSMGPSSSSQSLGPGGRRLRTVDTGMAGLFGDEDEDDGADRKRKMQRELGAEGDVDELDYEETFQDDEEKMEPDEREDEEAKELEERLKREYKNANKQREGYIDESDEDEEELIKLTQEGKTLQKTLKKLEKDGGYDESDEEENPYASEVEEEEEEQLPVQTGPAIIPPEPKPGRTPSLPPSTPVTMTSRTKTPTLPQQATQVKAEPQPDPLSRPTSPVPTPTPSHGGHSVVAKRATSPKAPKPKPSSPSRPGSPLASGRPTSPYASRATSPVASPAAGIGTESPVSAQSPTSPGAPSKPTNKRKATEEPAPNGAVAGAPSKPKKRKAVLPPGGVELEDRMVIEWLRNTPGATTRDCIHHFTPYLTDEVKKTRFTALVKEVAQLSKGVLVLRPAYRGDGGAASPAPAAAPAAA